jgi:hypothetical protein
LDVMKSTSINAAFRYIAICKCTFTDMVVEGPNSITRSGRGTGAANC